MIFNHFFYVKYFAVARCLIDFNMMSFVFFHHKVELLHHILSSPFVTQETAEEAGYAARPPLWAERLKVSCSS